jgi:hypothetical protein
MSDAVRATPSPGLSTPARAPLPCPALLAGLASATQAPNTGLDDVGSASPNLLLRRALDRVSSAALLFPLRAGPTKRRVCRWKPGATRTIPGDVGTIAALGARKNMSPIRTGRLCEAFSRRGAEVVKKFTKTIKHMMYIGYFPPHRSIELFQGMCEGRGIPLGQAARREAAVELNHCDRPSPRLEAAKDPVSQGIASSPGDEEMRLDQFSGQVAICWGIGPVQSSVANSTIRRSMGSPGKRVRVDAARETPRTQQAERGGDRPARARRDQRADRLVGVHLEPVLRVEASSRTGGPRSAGPSTGPCRAAGTDMCDRPVSPPGQVDRAARNGEDIGVAHQQMRHRSRRVGGRARRRSRCRARVRRSGRPVHGSDQSAA